MKFVRILTYIVSLFLSLFMLSGCDRAGLAGSVPHPSKGIMDIRGWSFKQSGVMSPKGEWNYYLNRLLISDEQLKFESVTPDGYLQLPGNWKQIRHPLTEEPFVFGSITFHIRIVNLKKGVDNEHLSIYFPQVRSASALYIAKDSNDPLLVDKSGKPDHDRKSHRPWFGALEGKFNADGVTDIYLEVSNFEDFNNQGTYKDIYIGTAEQIKEMRNSRRQRDFLLMGMICYAGIFMIIFFILRHSEFATLWLGLFSLTFALRIFVVELYAYEMLGGWLSFNSLLRLNYFTVYFLCLSYTAFLRSIFFKFFSKRVAYFIYTICIVYALVVHVTPAQIFSRYLSAFFIFIFTCLFWMLLGQFRALLQRKDMLAVMSLLGSLFIAISGGVDILSRANIIALQNTMHIGFSLNILCMSVIVSIHNARERNRVERLTKELSQEVVIRRNAEEEISLLNRQLTDRAEYTTTRLKSVEKELQKTEHKSELADITISTLHNIKNVLNSFKVSAQMLRDSWNNEFGIGYKKATELLKKKYDFIERYIVEDPKGKLLLDYYIKLEKVFDDETGGAKNSLRRMLEKIQAIEDIIDSQQRYGVHNRFEEVNPVRVIEDALNMQMGILGKRRVRIRRFLEAVPMIRVEKTQLLHVLINLIKNASEAMSEVPRDQRILDLITGYEDNHVKITVRDKGYGILPENLEKIFTRGFSTKTEGHGFGLNSSLNYVREMGGNMSVESEGKDRGATFILEFPIIADRE